MASIVFLAKKRMCGGESGKAAGKRGALLRSRSRETNGNKTRLSQLQICTRGSGRSLILTVVPGAPRQPVLPVFVGIATALACSDQRSDKRSVIHYFFLSSTSQDG